MTYEQEIEVFANYTQIMREIFAKKRHDYGPSTEETFNKFGIVSMIVRMQDKLNRLYTLSKSNDPAVDESVEDTLLDLANYAVITLLEIDKNKMLNVKKEIRPVCDSANTRR
jgi:hypothetical protein